MKQLYTYWRSQAAYRVRIALALKGLSANLIPLDLLKGDQLTDEYREMNPQMVVPTLIEEDGTRLVQSLAILEYLEERYPTPSLLPAKPADRAHARSIALTFAADAHPFVTPRVRLYLIEKLRVTEDGVLAWRLHWLHEALRAVEAILARDSRTGRCCVGDTPSVADLCLVPHVTTCRLWPSFDFSEYPTVKRVYEHCMSIEAFYGTAPGAG